jgi:hypothetical protein
MTVEDFSDSCNLTNPVTEKETTIPNGGLLAWLQVLGSFLLFFNSWYVHYPADCKANQT